MAQHRPWKVEDGLWELVEPLLPTVEPVVPVSRAQAMERPESAVRHLVRVVHGYSVGVPVAGNGYGSGMSCWRRLRD